MRMSVSAWFSLLLLLIVLWIMPIYLYFYEPKAQEKEGIEEDLGQEWLPMEYEEYKFRRRTEIVVMVLVCIGFGWLVWVGVSSGFLF